ncbi:MAG: FtsW/RodA/SpoVE family cell cycle protein [Acetobacteraceae bacterium]
MAIARTDTSLLGRWWWTVDHAMLSAVGVLFGFGYVLAMAAEPAAAHRLGDPRYHLLAKQMVFLAAGFALMLVISMLSPRQVRRLALAGGIVALLLTAATLAVGMEVLGARRWIRFPGFVMQPSEFLKPCFAVVTAWLLAERRRNPRFPGGAIALVLYAFIMVLLKEQPDVGMAVVITAVLFVQMFVDGLSLTLVAVSLLGMAAMAVAAYLSFHHVRMRVAEFLHPHGPDAYQIQISLKAFGNGGLLGRGLGEGRMKDLLPDAQADFIFAVAGEEMGLVFTALIPLVYAFIVLRGIWRLLAETEPFTVLAGTGLIASFGLQAFVNMASAMKMIPTKGMTLPFLSYGGSSAIAAALEVGMLLALSRRRPRGELA